MRKIIITSALVICSLSIISQVITPFTVRKTITQKGGIVYLANTSSKATPDNIVQNQIPPTGTGYDNNFTNAYVDIDSDATTWMSSSDQLNLASCSEITWAGLYWGADCSTGDENFATRNQVKLKVNSGAYIDLTSDYLKDNTAGYKSYHCFKDITAIMQANGINDRYTVANVATDVAGKNLFGGWTIVVVYKNNTQSMRNLTVFDGLANVSSGNSTVDIPISGFQTPLTGPVNFELGLVTYDGDRSLTGDQLLFKGGTSFINISDALHTTNDIFNSTISRNGVLTPLRNPSYNNNLGYDANIFSPINTSKNYIGNNAISAIIRQTTGGETYLTQVVTSAIDVYEPDLRSSVRVKNITNPASAKAYPGDILEYTVTGLNIGSDPSINSFITDTIEGNAFYVPGTIKILSGPNAGNMTDVSGDDQAEYIAASKVIKVRIGTGANNLTGGNINNSPTGVDSTQITFRVQVSSDCVMIGCDNVIDNRSVITGTGNISGNTYSILSNPVIFDPNGCPVTGSTKTEIFTTGCSAPTASVNTPVCPGGTLNFSATDSPSAIYLWTGPNNYRSTLRNPSISNATSINGGTYTCKISITGKPCEYIFTIDVVINSANAGPDQTGSTTCGLTTIPLAANQPTGTNGSWSIISGTGGSIATATNPVSNFSGVAGSSYSLRWTLYSPGCTTTTDDMNIRFNVGPTASVLSGNSTICPNNYANVRVVITGGTAPYTVTLNNNGGTFLNYTSGNDIMVGPMNTSTTFGLSSVTDANGCSSSALSGSAVVTVGDAISGTGIITQLNAPVNGGGPKTAGTGATATGTVWTNPTNTATSDSQYASTTITTNSNSAYLYLTNFGFTVPSGATIKGITVNIERFYTRTGTTATISSASIRVGTYNGSTFTTIGSGQTLAAFPLNTKATVTVGSATNLLGATSANLMALVGGVPTINTANFGIRIRAAATNTSGTSTATANIDYVTVKIDYTPAATYGDDNSDIGFSVSGYTNATTYTWAAPSGGSITSGQGTNSVLMNFNGAGQSGNYNVSVTPSNTCQTLSPLTLSIPIADNVNSTLHIKGNVYWDKNGMTDNLVNGTSIGSVNGTQLYVSIMASAGTTALQNSVAVDATGAYDFTVSASTAYKLVLSKNTYTVGQTVVAALPSGVSFTGEKDNDNTNVLTGNDGNVDGMLSIAGFTTNNNVNANFGIKIMTPPVALNDATSTNEDTQITYNVISNDSDPDGTVTASTVDIDQLTAGIQTTFSNLFGNWSVNSSGVVTYIPTANFNGYATLAYTVNDNESNTSNVGTLMVTVAPVNDPPTAVSDAVTTLEDTHVDFNVTTNDTDIDGTVNVSTVDLDTSIAGIQTTYTVDNQGTYTVDEYGIVTFTPVLNFNGVATPIHYTIKDNAGLTSANGTITVTVTSIVDPPRAANDVTTTNQNQAVSINVTTNDVGVDAAINATTVDLDLSTSGVQSDITIAGEGAYHANSSGVVTFTPSASFYGITNPLNYTVKDNFGAVSNTATLTITVVASSAPIAANDATTTTQGTPVSLEVTTNDVASNGSLNVSRIDLDPVTAGIQQSYDVVDKGTFMVDMTGLVTFQPISTFFGLATVDYTVKDNVGLVSNAARISVSVSQANQIPITVDDIVSTNEDTPITFNIVTNDFDSDGTIAANTVDIDINTPGRQTTFTVNGEGTYNVDNIGDVTFTPVENFNGEATPVGYFVYDNQGLSSDVTVPGLINVTVVSVNDAPVAVNDAYSIPSNTNFEFYITTNDTDIDGTIDLSSIDLNPSYIGVQKTFSVASEGTYTVDNNGLVTFSPSQGYIGPVTTTAINYTVKDNQGAESNSATITLTLSSENAPKALNDVASMNEDGTPIIINVLDNDLGGSGNINVATVDLDIVTVGRQTTKTITNVGTFTVDDLGVVTFTPVANYFGEATLNYVFYDDNTPTALLSNPASITVTILPVNDVPSFTKGANQSVANNSGVQAISSWISTSSVGPANESTQTKSYVITGNTNSSIFSDQPTIDIDGVLYYTPMPNTSGVSTITLKITDNGGTANGGVDASATQSFTITVNPILPTVTTTAISAITYNSATSGGDVTLNGGATVTARGIVWSTLPNPTIDLSTKTSNSSGNGTYASNLTSLAANTTYYVRAYATNSVGTSYGEEISFVTLAGQYVQTYNITPSPTFTTATISWSNGNMNSRVVFMKEGSGSISNPVNSTTYSASTIWENKGTQLGTSGYYCIYNGVGTSVEVTMLYPGRLYTIQAFEYNGSTGTESYLTNITGINNPATVIPWPTTTFSNRVGISTPESWNSSSRWDHDTIPTAALHEAVLVYIDGNCEVSDNAESHNLTIKAPHSIISPKVTIMPTVKLQVLGGVLGGKLTNNGSASALVIKSSSTEANGTLIYPNTAIDPVMGTVEMYSKAWWDLSAPMNSKYHWQYFGIPVKTMAYSTAFNSNSCYVYKWDETVDRYINIFRKQNDSTTLRQTEGNTLTSLTGYELVQHAGKTYYFSGQLENRDFVNIPLPYSTSAIYPGQHIFGNPYTAAIDLTKSSGQGGISYGANTEAAVYLYNTGTYNQWLSNNGEMIYNGNGEIPIEGQYTVSTQGTAGSGGVPSQIPSMQGFLVKAMNSSGGSITIPYSSVSVNASQQRAKGNVQTNSSEKVFTRIDLWGKHFADRMWIFTEPTCTHKFDNGWDGFKMFSSGTTPQLFAMEAKGDFQINVLNDMNETYLGFQTGLENEYKLIFTHENINTNYSAVYLVDMLENKTVDITSNGSEYSFTAVSTSTPTKRFKIITRKDGTELNDSPAQIKVFSSDRVVYIQNLSTIPGQMVIYNMSGGAAKTINFGANGITTIPLNFSSGAYIAKAKTNSEEATQRIIIP
jgi:CshA-type fibril repeat protein